MRLHLKVVNDELARLGEKAELAKGSGYFYFLSGETDNWIDRTVPVRTINSLTLKQIQYLTNTAERVSGKFGLVENKYAER